MAKRRPLLIAALIVLSALAALLALGVPLYRVVMAPRVRADTFIAARSAWSARPFSRYRMVIEQRWNGMVASPCRQEIDVDGRRVVRVRHIRCPEFGFFSPLSVDALLDLLEPRMTGRLCEGDDCACGRLSADVDYDASWGYPRRLSLTSLPGPFDRWLRWPPWAPLTCINTQIIGPQRFSVLSLTPLP